jgi:AraC-like DNA-binding protein
VHADNLPDWSFSMHSHENVVELSLVLNGHCELYFDRKIYHLKKGDFIIKNSGVPHSEKTDPNSPFEEICLALSGVRLKDQPENMLLPDGASPVIETGPSFGILKEMMKYIFNTAQAQCEGYGVILSDMAKALLSITTNLIDFPAESHTQAEFPVINDIIQYLDKYYYRNITLEELSNRFYFSTYYIARKFKEHTGYTINQYLINRRIGESERMLLYEDLSIKEIAKRNGFSNLQYFYSTFKKYTGCTPIDFKKSYYQNTCIAKLTEINRESSPELP